MHLRLVFCLSFASIQILGMTQPQQPQQIVESKRATLKKSLRKDFENKKEFFKGNPVVHGYFKVSVTYLSQKAKQADQTNNHTFFSRLLAEGFLVPAHEIQVQCNAAQQDPKASEERKKNFKFLFDTICNTTTFFTSDNDEHEKHHHNCYCGDCDRSSKTTFKKIYKDPEILHAYDKLKSSNTIASHLEFLTTCQNKFFEVFREYGLQFPQVNAQGYASITKFLELNEQNRTFHNPNNYERSKHAFISLAIIDLYFSTFEQSESSIGNMLLGCYRDFELNSERIAKGEPEVDSPCHVQ